MYKRVLKSGKYQDILEDKIERLGENTECR